MQALGFVEEDGNKPQGHGDHQRHVAGRKAEAAQGTEEALEAAGYLHRRGGQGQERGGDDGRGQPRSKEGTQAQPLGRQNMLGKGPRQDGSARREQRVEAKGEQEEPSKGFELAQHKAQRHPRQDGGPKQEGPEQQQGEGVGCCEGRQRQRENGPQLGARVEAVDRRIERDVAAERDVLQKGQGLGLG